jgi:branched-subunit amino acid permease
MKNMLNTLFDYTKVSVIAITNFVLSYTNLDEILKVLIGFLSLIYIVAKLIFLFKDRKKKKNKR